MDLQTVYVKNRVPYEEQCESSNCGAEAGFEVTIIRQKDEPGITRRLCSGHTGHSLDTALLFNLGHHSVRIGFEEDFVDFL